MRRVNAIIPRRALVCKQFGILFVEILQIFGLKRPYTPLIAIYAGFIHDCASSLYRLPYKSHNLYSAYRDRSPARRASRNRLHYMKHAVLFAGKFNFRMPVQRARVSFY